MLQGKSVLIVEDEPIIAADLAFAVEAAEGVVVGPFRTGEAGLAAHASGVTIDGAILDVRLADGEITPLACALLANGIVVVFHTASPVPYEITLRHGDRPVCSKPMSSETVVQHLALHMDAG